MFSKNFLGNLASIGSQRMITGSNHEKRNTGQPLIGQRIRNRRERSDDADAATAVEHGFNGSAERLDIDAERHSRVFLPKLLGHLSNRVDRIEDVNHHGQFRLQANRHALRPGLQQVDPGDDAASVAQNGQSRWGEFGIAAGAVEQLHANLFLKIADCLTHHRLRAQQLAGGGRKASFIGRGDERAQLIERNGVEHGTYLSTKPMLKRRMLLPNWRSYQPSRSRHSTRESLLAVSAWSERPLILLIAPIAFVKAPSSPLAHRGMGRSEERR